MKAHEYWSVGALITMLGTFYSGYKGSKSSHKYFAASSLLCMIMAIYTGHRIISKNKKTEKESNSIENMEVTRITEMRSNGTQIRPITKATRATSP